MKCRTLKVTLWAAMLLLLSGSIAEAAGSAPQPSICQRACWSARAPQCSLSTMSSLNRAIIHHTATSTDYNTTTIDTSKTKVRAHQNYHMDVNGWCDIGYNFLTDKLGNSFEGRSGSMTVNRKGAHDGVNTNSFGFSMMGYFHSPYNHTPTAAHKTATYNLIAWRMPNPFTGYGSGTYNGKTVGFVAGHRNAVATACPGDIMYAFIGTNFTGGEARNAINARITGGGGTTVIVDNDTANFSASANWTISTATPGYYGNNYQWRATEAISDVAAWNVNLPSAGSYTVSARWVAGTNRSTGAPYQIVHDGGTTTVNVNQQNNNNTWVTLGTFNFPAGASQKIKLSCWATSGFVVVADAVRFVKN